MFLDFDTGAQRCFGVVVKNRDGGLCKNSARVHALIDHVDGASAELRFRCKDVSVGMGAGKIRKQRRVDVHDAPAPPPQHHGRKEAHVTCKHDEFNVVSFEFGQQTMLVLFA